MTSKKDSFFNLKYIGYVMSNLPPEEVETDYYDFVRYCKFQLCKATQKLMKDPTWDKYEDEDIIAEYYAYIYSKDGEPKDKFEAALLSDGYNEDIYAWLDKMVENNQKEMKERAEKLENEVEFTPDSLGE
jgi:hypothetical protein